MAWSDPSLPETFFACQCLFQPDQLSAGDSRRANASQGAHSPIVSALDGAARNLERLREPAASGTLCCEPFRSAYPGFGAGAQAASHRILLSLSAPSGGRVRDLPEPPLLAAGEQLAGAIQKLPLPLAHLNRVNGVVSGDLLDRFATTDRLHGDSGLEFRTVGAALTHRWEPRLGAMPRLRG